MVKLVITSGATKNLSRIPRGEQKKIQIKLHRLRDNPLAGKLLSGHLHGLYSVRAWPYRVVYSFDKHNKIVFVVRILHRKEVYN